MTRLGSVDLRTPSSCLAQSYVQDIGVAGPKYLAELREFTTKKTPMASLSASDYGVACMYVVSSPFAKALYAYPTRNLIYQHQYS